MQGRGSDSAQSAKRNKRAGINHQLLACRVLPRQQSTQKQGEEVARQGWYQNLGSQSQKELMELSCKGAEVLRGVKLCHGEAAQPHRGQLHSQTQRPHPSTWSCAGAQNHSCPLALRLPQVGFRSDLQGPAQAPPAAMVPHTSSSTIPSHCFTTAPQPLHSLSDSWLIKVICPTSCLAPGTESPKQHPPFLSIWPKRSSPLGGSSPEPKEPWRAAEPGADSSCASGLLTKDVTYFLPGLSQLQPNSHRSRSQPVVCQLPGAQGLQTRGQTSVGSCSSPGRGCTPQGRDVPG